ncbi:LPXTG cell wall anchor domain-containing protein [Bogoriella caseilytica]|uniref:LPXTG cell wall anchor domain-containing protein n=1 Tax=Bogoriella caseilytica TaxID=56055 RepID=UPI0014735141|nr:LPXTG cell wall anchor domain-containing protein [Bogoriella caseilytica]
MIRALAAVTATAALVVSWMTSAATAAPNSATSRLPSTGSSVLILLVSTLVLVAIGAWLTWRAQRRRD